MEMPVIGRWLAAVAGGLLVLTAWGSVIGTLIVPCLVGSRLTRWVDRLVNGAFGLVTTAIAEYRRRDRVLVRQAAAILLVQLAAWLGVAFRVRVAAVAAGTWRPGVGVRRSRVLAVHPRVQRAARGALGDRVRGRGDRPGDRDPADRLPADAVRGVQPEETEVTLLNARAGVPSWGPELLARTHYALGSGMSTLDTLPDLYARWERWAADVTESHTTYLPLVRFRSPRPLSSWVTALLAVLDSAALFLALSPKAAPVVPARLCLRSGFTCFNQIARAMGLRCRRRPTRMAGSA